MGLLWTLTASILVGEIFLILLFLIPFLSAKRWKSIFNFRIFAFISDYMIYLVVGLGILFVSSVSKLRKCQTELNDLNEKVQFANADLLQLKRSNLFIAQRNFYISFFSLFLWLVLTRLVKLITAHGQLQLEYEAMKKQALSATESAQKFLNEATTKDENRDGKKSPAMVELENELEVTKQSLDFANSLLKTTQTELDAMKRQAEATKREYDRLLNESHPAGTVERTIKKEN